MRRVEEVSEMKRLARWMVVMVLSTGACADDAEPASGDAANGGSADAAPATPGDNDADGSVTVLVGSWESFDYPFQYSWTFNLDGTCSSYQGGDAASHFSGRYVVRAGHQLVIDGTSDLDPASEQHYEWTYHAGAEYFAPAAFLPQGSHDGIVGDWFGQSSSGEREASGSVRFTSSIDDEAIFRADGTVTRTTTVDGYPDVLEGTYHETAPGVFETDVAATPFRLMDDAAIDHQVFQRQ
jgi:hypothetical protein